MEKCLFQKGIQNTHFPVGNKLNSQIKPCVLFRKNANRFASGDFVHLCETSLQPVEVRGNRLAQVNTGGRFTDGSENGLSLPFFCLKYCFFLYLQQPISLEEFKRNLLRRYTDLDYDSFVGLMGKRNAGEFPAPASKSFFVL